MQLHDVLQALGGTPLGYTPASGYLHTRSKSQRGSSFVGLPLDLVNQPELTEARVGAWCAQLSQELQQHAGGGQVLVLYACSAVHAWWWLRPLLAESEALMHCQCGLC